MTVDPTRIVADVDVLVRDLFLDDTDRDALDQIRAHSWLTLIVNEAILEEATTIITAVADRDLAADWQSHLTAMATIVAYPPGDHPVISAAVRGNAAQLLTHDPQLLSAETGATFHELRVSAKPPDAFVRQFDPDPLYREYVGGAYPGPDRDPRE